MQNGVANGPTRQEHARAEERLIFLVVCELYPKKRRNSGRPGITKRQQEADLIRPSIACRERASRKRTARSQFCPMAAMEVCRRAAAR